MYILKELYKRDTLSAQGNDLSKKIRQKMLRSDDDCWVDFTGIVAVTPVFFQDLIFPLVIEFGGHVIDSRIKFKNPKDHHLAAYKAAIDQTSDYMDKLCSRHISAFGGLSDIIFELLLIARDLSRSDPDSARVIFGFNSDMLKSFAAIDIDTIRRISNAGAICFEPRLSPEFIQQLTTLDPSEVDVFLNVAGSLRDVYEPI